MEKPDKRVQLSGIVLNTLDDNRTTEEMSQLAYQSRTQFHRLFRAIVEETPAALRRRLLLERAAFQLSQSDASITDIALNANYGSLEAFTRAFRKAFRTSHSLYRRMRVNLHAFASTEQDSLPRPRLHRKRRFRNGLI